MMTMMTITTRTEEAAGCGRNQAQTTWNQMTWVRATSTISLTSPNEEDENNEFDKDDEHVVNNEDDEVERVSRKAEKESAAGIDNVSSKL